MATAAILEADAEDDEEDDDSDDDCRDDVVMPDCGGHGGGWGHRGDKIYKEKKISPLWTGL